jgi:hypothetical protein
MNRAELLLAVKDGRKFEWRPGYRVIADNLDQMFVECIENGHFVFLSNMYLTHPNHTVYEVPSWD